MGFQHLSFTMGFQVFGDHIANVCRCLGLSHLMGILSLWLFTGEVDECENWFVRCFVLFLSEVILLDFPAILPPNISSQYSNTLLYSWLSGILMTILLTRFAQYQLPYIISSFLCVIIERIVWTVPGFALYSHKLSARSSSSQTPTI
jgi:hypothetical protein